MGVMLLGFAAVCTLVAVAYAKTPTPAEPTVQGVEDQASIFYYANGKELGRIGKKRQSVQLGAQGEKPTTGKVPDFVQNAVLAAENRSFRSDKGGISIKGTGRAVWVNLTGGKGGGSTITQQLAKNYYSDVNNRTMSRKFKELFISMKLEDKHSKDEILRLYLNTIYFGRDTYGIQAASREYFHTDVWKLKPDQAAFLGGLIQNPNRDPSEQKNKNWIKERYDYTLNGLVTMGKMDTAQATSYKAKLPYFYSAGSSGNTFGGQKGYMLMRAKLELERQGITSQKLTTEGLRVTTTFDPKMMVEAKNAAEKTVPQVNPKKLAKKKIRVGLISVESKTGKVRAFYGGPDYLSQSFDNVWLGSAQAGSAMKPYVLAAALKKGYSLQSLVDGRSMVPIDTQGNITPGGVKFRTGHAKPAMNLIEATQWSNNTAYVQLGFKVGSQDVFKTATDAGIASTLLNPHKGGAGMFLGANDIRPVEQAAGYAAFANGGTYYQPRVIEKVLEPDKSKSDQNGKGKVTYKERKLNWEKHRVFDESVAAKATYAMRKVVTAGTATAAQLPDGREAAGKTGTTDNNVATWFVGYVPQLSTAVTLFNDNYDKKLKRKKSLILPGVGEVQGGTIPAKIWRSFMAGATEGMTAETFPQASMDGTVYKYAQPPKKKEKDEDEGKPGWCKLPGLENHPRCKGDNEPEPGDPGNKPPCQSPVPDGNCDPNKPPFQPPPDWWCRAHPDQAQQYPTCRKGDDGGRPGNGETPPFPNQQQTQPAFFLPSTYRSEE
ncbi:transglycosylase domain-containing protein [Actinomadura rudentiformis]|uniref:Penicillin-binding protein n=1 Tax=Actinomadura rudentiformis TaxID=359158 RepID=A0A6H9YBS3_9ACTN|nr:transglycosylase domain-containing protein [Actinomadura rudentiformis]KAB2340774.1 penicillin-binding protein [Actinomadura rudentiformis]